MHLTTRAVRAALVVALAAGAFAPVVAHAALPERVSNASDRAAVNLTIYNGGNSLIHDRRHVFLTAGENAIAWRGVSGQIDATSAILSDLTVPGGVSVVEQNFNFDLLSPNALLMKYVGHDVIVVHDRPQMGRPIRETARLLAANDGIVLQYRGRIETGLQDSHLEFPTLPANLRDQPTLVLDVTARKASVQSLDLAYLTGGLGWSADYVGVVTPDEKYLTIAGLVTLTNGTGVTYTNARVQLVAGNVHFQERQREVGLQKAMLAIPAPTPAVTQQNYFEYHLYTLGRPTTVANAQTKQVAFLSAKDVPIRKTLELRGSPGYYRTRNADLGTNLKIGVFIAFTNKDGDLGIPLPGGTFRLYENDRGGTSQYLGADRIDHTPRDRDVRLHVGDSFDVTANRKQTDFKAVSACTYESRYRIALSNAKDAPQDVLVVEPIPGTWSITAENYPHEKTSSSTASWHITVPARQTVSLEYTAHVTPCI